MTYPQHYALPHLIFNNGSFAVALYKNIMKKQSELLQKLETIATAIKALSPEAPQACDFSQAHGFLWHGYGQSYSLTHSQATFQQGGYFEPIDNIQVLPLHLLRGIDTALSQLYDNTQYFCQGFPANNALLWGTRGMGKSSAVKSVHHSLVHKGYDTLKLVEIERDDINTLPFLLGHLRRQKNMKFIVFCDDLSFDAQDTSYKALKTVLEGGIQGRPENCIFYATSNRRHLMSRDSIENEMETAQFSGEAVEEKLSLSDRFGLWIGFHKCHQDTFFAMIEAYRDYYGIPMNSEMLRKQAIEWSMTRGGRSGRIAWQFIQYLLGQYSMTLSPVEKPKPLK